jgi:F-type H+-transporting ATPase subunit b
MEQLLNDFSPGLFIMQSVLMLAVIFLMVKFAWKPIVSALDEREEGIKNALEGCRKGEARDGKHFFIKRKTLSIRLVKNVTSMLKEAREMKAKMIAEAEANAEARSSKNHR